MGNLSKAARTTCEFCDEFAAGRSNAYFLRYGLSLPERTVLESGPFRVLPSLGQIAEGHLLIVPLHHFCSMSELSNDQALLLDQLCGRLRIALRGTYGQCVFFEHGIRREGSGGCGIDHAHMHAVPVTADGVLNMLTEEFEGNRIGPLGDIARVSPDSSYLFFENITGERYVFPVDNLPSQYLRKLVAGSIGKADWDWRECGYEDELVSTIERLSPLFHRGGVGYKG